MRYRRRGGFTEVGLLVVILSIGFLLVLVILGCGYAREHGRAKQCLNNQHNIALAFKGYEATTQSLPGWKNRLGVSRVPVSWVPPLFPFLDRSDLADLWKRMGTPDERLLANSRLKVLICPSNPPDASTATGALAYPVNCGRGTNTKACDGVFFDLTISAPMPPRVFLSDVPDGAAYTLLIGESLHAGPWHPDGKNATAISSSATPANAGTGGVGFIWEASGGAVADQLSSRHAGGAVVSFCDGHQQFLWGDIDYVVYQHLMTPDSAAAGIPGTLRREDF